MTQRKTIRDKMEPCPVCIIGRMNRRAGANVELFDCGTSRVDGELRIGPNCQQYADNAVEIAQIKALLAEKGIEA